ncbi:hypothetical protein [Natranaerobius trueperi]|uniref:SipL SPOCS domain-containing protein n=1 Tax=Natranaerobius trueperi TaxID=759412 RepID=A0A226BZX3_9FIRM|nr:hypothetical protein [Natranaerobius trueperi]OWZ84352.1 hypothetical protein CDO51_03560 [Natranaerobius trueperi]
MDDKYNQIYPGPVTDGHKLPPPKFIDCIKVDKVYEECKFTDVNEIKVDIPIDIEDEIITEDVNDVKCLNVEVLEKECKIVADNKVRVWIKYEITYTIEDETFTEIETFETIVFLQRAGEEGLKPQCEVFLECLDAFVLNDKIVLCIGKLILFKLIAHVQLLVPVYGFCPEPEECRVAGECPEFAPDWPPYPEQE